MAEQPLFTRKNSGKTNSSVILHCPKRVAKASGFLWNKVMMIQMNCQGYAVAQHMQPEPAKYAHGPSLEAATFMQPEHSYFSHHPGRFFYLKDIDNNNLFSIPYAPVKAAVEHYEFEVASNAIHWRFKQDGLLMDLTLTLDEDRPIEIWQLTVTNTTKNTRKIDVYPYFPVGYMSWMNQSADYHEAINGIIATSITPYQKVEDYNKNKALKDLTFFLSNKKPSSWSCVQAEFEGETGLHAPQAIKNNTLTNNSASYQIPAACMQFPLTLDAGEKSNHQFLFGAANNKREITDVYNQYFSQVNKSPLNSTTAQQKVKTTNEARSFQEYQQCLILNSGCEALDDLTNHWLPRQVFYHGEVNRFTTDPQTRNFLQDNMGLSFLQPNKARSAFLLAMSQQYISGALPDGILLHQDATLKYINQVPHADHCVWLPICLLTYINETGDVDILNQVCGFQNSNKTTKVSEHVELALQFLIKETDHRKLSFIKQGDWCDPMNMVGHLGKGVSTWLSQATVYALTLWCDFCQNETIESKRLTNFRTVIQQMNEAINHHFWDGNWYGRGITDNGKLFGSHTNKEGKIYLNPQSWAMLSGCADKKQINLMNQAIKEQLYTPFGVMMLAPSYTQMDESIGRLTQKSAGVSENGSVYNHASIFYIYGLFIQGFSDLAFDLLMKMIPSHEDIEIRNQLPVFIPNYYRGDYFQQPKLAGRSSQLFNTGTVSWLYLTIIEQLCGLKGQTGKLVISPNLPRQLNEISGVRLFRGATFNFSISKTTAVTDMEIVVDGTVLVGNIIDSIETDKIYRLNIRIPLDPNNRPIICDNQYDA